MYNPGKLLKTYTYGKWGYVRVEVYERQIAVYKDPTGTRQWFTLSQREEAFGVARHESQRYGIISRKFGE